MNHSKALKLVFVGNVGSGKTSSINAISEVPIAGTEAKASEADALHRKPSTTVALEYGIVHLHGAKLHIYGTPGQRRFDFMASLLCKGAKGMVIMIDNGHTNPLGELNYFLQFHKDFLEKYPAIVAITHYDDNNTNTLLIEYHQYVRDHGFSCAVTRLDARSKEDVLRVVDKLVMAILPSNTAPDLLQTPHIAQYCYS
ncbi:MAG: ATP/GTP-binding protein [Methylovulum sp.]|nr:ATP/GTP-binding protein [Methylovulum sp.]